MAHFDDDEDLQLAVALSLQQSPVQDSIATNPDNEAIDLTSDTEDEDEDENMRRAIALSLLESTGSQDTAAVARTSSPAATTVSNPIDVAKPAKESTSAVSLQASGRPANMFGIDRNAMEQERLARLGKRKRSSSPERPSKQVAKTCPAKQTQSSNIKTATPPNSELQYPRGAIKRTFATKYPRTDDITLDEVLQANTVDIAVISSFMWDAEWLWKKLSPVRTKQIWIMNVKDKETQERYRREMHETQVPNLKIHYPPMNGMIQAMHSKLMLLFGKSKLRIVVPTANMTPIDWGEVENDWQPGCMENSVFLIDLPRREDGIGGDVKDVSNFGTELTHFLKKQEVGNNVIEGVLKFDFSQTDHLAFVHSM